MIREWLLLLLRFAITREPADATAVVSIASDLDSLGLQPQQLAPTFFRRTSAEVCNAIVKRDDDPERVVALKRHLARIDERRMRRAFEAAVDFKESRRSRRKQPRLWDGLRR
jgi:hypothetical protein